jgi:hypothetical protein
MVKVKPKQVIPFTGAFVERNSRVQVIEDVFWKKKSLRNKRGLVVLPTDEDGDIGVQFDDPIDAGSLDGAGTEGCCLYLPATAVENLSE